MRARRIKDREGPLYGELSQAALAALDELRATLLDVGFVVNRRRAREGTLRVYPVRHQTYPLLNPGFYTDDVDPSDVGDDEESEEDDGFPEEGVAIRVLSKGDHADTSNRLKNFVSSEKIYFRSIEALVGEYWDHGAFFVPLTFSGPLDSSTIEFAVLNEPLTDLLKALRD